MTRSRSTFACRRGYAMLTSLVVVMMLGILGVSLSGLSVNSVRASGYRRDMQTAFELAEAGVRYAVYRLVSDKTYAGQGDTAFGEGTFRVEIGMVAGQPTHRSVTGVGRVMSLGGSTVERRIGGVIDTAAMSGIWNHAIISQGPIALNGSVTVDSTPAPNEGHVHTNSTIGGAVSVTGNPLVRGHVSAVGTVVLTGSPSITEGAEDHAPPVPFPAVDTAALRAQAAANSVTQGNVNIASSNTVTLRGKINGDLRISGSPRIILDGPIWVTGTIEITGGASTYFGDGILIAEGGVHFSGNGGFTSGDGFTILALSPAGPGDSTPALEIAGNVNIKGSIYVPNGHTKITGTPTIFGSIAAQSIDVKGNPHVTRNTDYRSPGGLNTAARLLYWKEL